jgi:FkbH-like protein
MAHANPTTETKKSSSNKVKCLVWDLDNTLWNGILLEDKTVTLRDGVRDLIIALDARGILHSIASRNEEAIALEKLKEFGLAEYFLYPQINWGSKAESVKRVAEKLNIGLDTLAFVDDQPFEREEVQFNVPEVLCLDVGLLSGVLDREEFNPEFVTEDSRLRRLMYLEDQQRARVEEEFVGTKDEFLRTLNMHFRIYPATEEDLKRAEELTLRTNQLNTTGYSYSVEELRDFSTSPGHLLLVATLEDKFGSYGKIGLALVEKNEAHWTIKLLLMSCRVMSRGVGTIMLNHIMAEARATGVRLRAELVHNGRNRMMHVTYRFAGFKEIGSAGEVKILENSLEQVAPFPDHLVVTIG